MAQTLKLFSARLQQEADFTGRVDLNGELVFECSQTGEFIKMPAGMSVPDIKAAFAQHKTANEGQVSIADSEATLGDLMATESPVIPADQPTN